MLAEYEYDAWGNSTILRNINNMANTNPLRYRGYYYDTDTGLYYLQSRYYDSNIGRFINADDSQMITEEQDNNILQYNLFAYCGNSIMDYKDKDGKKRVKSRRKYDRYKVKKYINKWYKGHNPNYPNRDGKGGDCTNFVSQCLYYGGFPMNFNWRCVQNSKLMYKVKKEKYYATMEWANANELCSYVYVSMTRYKVYEIKSSKELKKVYKNLETGDLLFFNTMLGNSLFNHAAIIKEVKNGEIKYAQHTQGAIYELFKRIKQQKNNWKKGWKIRIYHVGDYAEWR